MSWRRLGGKRWSGYLSWRRRRRFVHRREVLDALIAAVHEEVPDQLLVTGDLVHIGLPEEIRAAAQWLESLGPPERVVLVPGNHDVYAADSWPEVARAWGPYLAAGGAAEDSRSGFPVLRQLPTDVGPVRLIGLSSAEPTPLFMASGRLGGGQLAALADELADREGFRAVLLHHPPLRDMTSRRKGLGDAGDLAGVLARHGAELVLHGHVHRNVTREGPGGSRIYGTASASSCGGRAAAAYRSFDIEADDGRFRVTMQLVEVRAGGQRRVLEEDQWQTAGVRAPASAVSAAR